VVKKNLPQGKLAVVVPHSGQPTETFIRRYCEQLAPGNTVLVHFYNGADTWVPDCPTFFLQDAFFGSAKLARIYRGFQKALGIGSLFGDPYTAGALKRFLLKNNVSVVFSQYLVTGWNIHHVVQSLGLKHVVRGLGFDTSGYLDNPIWRRRYLALQSAKAIVVTSPFQVERLLEIGMSGGNLIPLFCGVDIPELANRQKNRPANSCVQFIAAGRMVPKKAPLKLLKAFFIAAKEVDEINLVYIGDGPLMQEAVEFAKRDSNREKVNFLGRLPHGQMLDKIVESDVFIQHSVTDSETGDQEGVPVAILEAMAHGLPVVSTRHSGIPHAVKDGCNGFLTAEGDVEAMARSIVHLCRNAELRASMGAEGRRLAGTFTWEIEKKRLLEVLF